jgi:hypothetical protein
MRNRNPTIDLEVLTEFIKEFGLTARAAVSPQKKTDFN